MKTTPISAVLSRASRVAPLACLLVACGDAPPPQSPPPPPPRATAPARTSPPVPSPSVPPPEPRRAAVVVEALSTPSAIACALTTASWQQGTIKLTFGPGTEPFATVNRPKSTKASLPVGAGPVHLELDVDAAIVAGYVDAADVSLFSADAIPLRDAFVLLPGVALKWQGVEVDLVKFAIPIDRKRAVPADGSLDATKPCAYFSLDRKDFQPLRATATDSSRRTAIRPGTYEVTNEAIGGKVVATIVSDPTAPYAVHLATQGARTRIAWRVGEAVVYGWIDTKFTATNPETIQSGEWSHSPPSPQPPARDTSFAPWKQVVCAEEVPLIAEVGGQRRVVGRVKAGKTAQIGPERDGLVPITLPESDFLPTDRAKLFVAVDKATSCK